MSRSREIDPPVRVEEALRRSAQHARNAVAEALLAAQALLDAVALATTGRAASASQTSESGRNRNDVLGALADRIARVAQDLRGEEPDLPESWTRAVLEALDHEIERWETRSRNDPDARAVLRAFISLREILWEFGLRGSTEARNSGPNRATEKNAPPGPSNRTARVQHIKVEG